jgi:hypothetical protein
MEGYIEKPTQEQRILAILREAVEKDAHEGWVDGMMFLRLQRPITQYHARIFGLQQKGYEIESRYIAGHNWKEYRLLSEPVQTKLL